MGPSESDRPWNRVTRDRDSPVNPSSEPWAPGALTGPDHSFRNSGRYRDFGASSGAVQPRPRTAIPMEARSRPLSPHLQVYKPQLTSVLSISHRATGVALAVGTLLFVWWLAAAAAGPESYETVQDFIGSWFGMLLLFGWLFCL